jgi:hypothetical protein
VVVISRSVRELTFGRVISAALVGASLVCAILLGVFAYHVVAAQRAHDVPTSPTMAAVFAEALRGWIARVDLPVRRLALSSAEEYGSGNYIFVFEVYSWFGIGSGYVTYGDAGGGGVLRDGGFAGIGEHASESGLQQTRAAWMRTYGPGRLVAPAP